jgi:membrane protease YdiL (CAAX protease family)
VAAVVAGLLGLAGLLVWRASRLPSLTVGDPSDARARFVRPAAWLGLGLAVGLLFLGVLRLLIEPAVPAAGARLAAAAVVPLWRRVLVIYVAAVSEEVVFRLVLLSFVAGVVTRALRLAGRTPSRNVAWAANGVSALVFAAVHLPAWYAVGPVSAGLALIVLALNGAGGAVFGYLFVTRGIVAAIWAHAGADIATQLIGPLTR